MWLIARETQGFGFEFDQSGSFIWRKPRSMLNYANRIMATMRLKADCMGRRQKEKGRVWGGGREG